MEKLQEYNLFVQTLEKKANGGLFFHRINSQIYITDHSHRLVGIWDLTLSEPIDYKALATQQLNSY